MKEKCDRQIVLRCVVCGSDCDFEYNDDKSYIKCKKCNREYFGGYDELVKLNEEHIQEEINDFKIDLKENIENHLSDSLRKALKGNKYIKLK